MFVLNKVNSIANHYLAEIRDTSIQKNRLLFRKNMERLGEILAYELSKSLEYSAIEVSTPLGSSTSQIINEQPVLITILRAGIPFYQGVLNFFSEADSGFIGAYRAPHKSAEDIVIEMDYVAMPSVQDKTVIMIDPMLASGKSMVKSIQNIQQYGIPSHVHIIRAIAAPEGISLLENELNMPYTVWTGAVDEKLNNMAYIVPGLGDAGDLSFGEKV